MAAIVNSNLFGYFSFFLGLICLFVYLCFGIYFVLKGDNYYE